MRWTDVPPDVLTYHNSALSLLTPEGFAHYLPAFMTLTVLEPARVDIAGFNTLLSLIPPSDPDQAAWWMSRVSRLTGAQRRAVVRFLRHLRPSWERDMPEEFEQALFFWGKFAERIR